MSEFDWSPIISHVVAALGGAAIGGSIPLAIGRWASKNAAVVGLNPEQVDEIVQKTVNELLKKVPDATKKD